MAIEPSDRQRLPAELDPVWPEPETRKGTGLPATLLILGGLWVGAAYAAVTVGEGTFPWFSFGAMAGLVVAAALPAVAVARWTNAIENSARERPDRPGVVWLVTMPPVVELARYANAINVGRGFALGLILLRNVLAKPELDPGAASLVLTLGWALCLALTAISLWLSAVLACGWRSGWYAQLLLAVLWIVGRRGADRIAGVLVLSGWFRRDTRAWFGFH